MTDQNAESTSGTSRLADQDDRPDDGEGRLTPPKTYNDQGYLETVECPECGEEYIATPTAENCCRSWGDERE